MRAPCSSRRSSSSATSMASTGAFAHLRARLCMCVHQLVLRAWCVRGLACICVRSKLDQLMHQASKDATKAAAVKAAKQERRIATAM